MHQTNAPAIYRHTLTIVASLYFFLALSVSLFSNELVALLAPGSYSGAGTVVSWVAFGQAIWGLYPILSIGPKIAKQTSHLAYVSVATAIFNVVLNLILLPRMGIRAAAIATFASYVVLVGGTYWVGQYSSYRFPLDWLRLLRLGLICLLLLSAGFSVTQLVTEAVPSYLLRGSLLLLYPFLLVLSGILTLSDLRTFYNQGRRLVRRRRLKRQPA